jgi:hypothetical protein
MGEPAHGLRRLPGNILFNSVLLRTPQPISDLALYVFDDFLPAAGMEILLHLAQRNIHEFLLVRRAVIPPQYPSRSNVFKNLPVVRRQHGLVTGRGL